MRLELEQNQSTTPFAENATAETSLETRAAEASEHLRDGIKAAQSGNRSAARVALLRAAELDPRSESAWLWLSSISEYPEELLVFLTNVLEINPLNARAIEWSAATKALLAKNFVQRGIDAAEANQNDTAAQHFNQALEYDERNSMAWLWLASLSESNEGKLSYLEKVLEFDPENESAKAGYEVARNSIRAALLTEARSAAVAGRTEDAEELLDAIVAEEPNAEDAWVLRSHMANGFEAKIASFKRILEINPDNAGAKAGLESLTSIMDAVAATEVKTDEPVEAEKEAEEGAAQFEQTTEGTQDDEAIQATYETEVGAFEDIVDEETIWEPIEEESPVASAFSETSPFDSFAEESKEVSGDEDFNESAPGAEFASANDTEGKFETVHPIFENVEKEPVFRESENETVDALETEEFAEEAQVSSTLEFAHDEQIDSFEEARDEPEFVHEFVEELASAEFSGEAEAHFDDAPAIYAPSINPFDIGNDHPPQNEFATIVSLDIDAETLAAVQSYDPQPVSSATAGETAFDVPFDATMYGAGKIPMPFGDMAAEEPSIPTGYETHLFVDQSNADVDVAASAPETTPCSYCGADNDIQAIACQGCLSVLTLADLELILANQHADKSVLRQAVDRMESEKAVREFSEAELTTLGIGHLNLRNLQFGYNFLQEASQKNPNNVVLSGQVNALLIRLDEIRRQDEAHESMSKGKTILVVDDSPTVRKLIAGKLEKCGHEVICSSDGVEAMVQLESLRPDLVLLDITMPRMDGYQVCKLIRSNSTTKDVPVVMISGKDGFFDKVRGRMAGTSGYITKPFGPETLMKAVESYLKEDFVVEA